MAAGEISETGKERINAAVALAEEETGLEYCVVIAPTAHGAPREDAERVFAKTGMNSRPAVLIMVVPSERTLEVVVADDVSDRLSNKSCDEAVSVMTGLFAADDIVGGLVRGVEVLAEGAGPRAGGESGHVGEDLPNVVDLGDG